MFSSEIWEKQKNVHRHTCVPIRPRPTVLIPPFCNGFETFVPKNSQRSVNNLCVVLWNADTLLFSRENKTVGGDGVSIWSYTESKASFTNRQSCSAEQRHALLRSVQAEHWEIMAHDEHNKELDLKNRFCQCVYSLQNHNSINLQCVLCSGGRKKSTLSMLCSTQNGDWQNKV